VSAEAVVDVSVQPRTPPDYLSLARNAYTTSSNYFDSGVRAQIEAAIRQFNSQHPAGSKYLSEAYKARSKFFRPKTRSMVRRHEAIAAEAFFSNDDVVAVEPENDDDPVGIASAQVHKFLLAYRLKKTIPWFQTVIGGYQDAQTVGVVCSLQWWDYDEATGKDEPCIDLVPVENIRFDPAADWRNPIKTSPYVIHLMPMYVQDVRAKMEQKVWKQATETEILTAVRSQGDTIRQQRETPRPDSKEATTAITAFTVVWVHRNIVTIDGFDVVYHTLGTETMLDEPVPLAEFVWHGQRPYVLGCCVIESHKNYPNGPVGLTKETQGELNGVVNARMDNWLYNLNRRYFVKRNSQVDTRSLQRNSPGGSTLMNDPEKDVKVLDTQDVTRSAGEEQDRLSADFDELSGAFSTSSVDSNRRLNETVGGMNIISTTSNQMSGYQLRTFVETWVEPVLRQLQLLEAYYETDTTIIALAGKAAAQQMAKIGASEVTDDIIGREMLVSVNVGMGATNPHTQVDNFLSGMKSLKEILGDGVLDRYGIDVEEVTKELFSKLGYRSGSRFFRWNDQDPAIIALQGQVKQLQDALDKKIPPELLAAQVAKLAAETKDKLNQAVESGVRAAFSAMQAAEVIAAVPQVAPIADEVMKAAGYQEPNPAGVDPNFPQGAGGAGLAINPVKNIRTGMQFTPGAAGDTSPQTPAAPTALAPPGPAAPTMPAAPPTPGIGAERGINTMRPDS
jgi:hypothetical protein